MQIVEQINDPRIRIINKPNGGVSSARNRGIKEAKYEWIAFLDGDDLWEINHLEEVVRMMSIFPEEKVFATSYEYSDKREMFRHSRDSEIFIVQNYFKEALRESLLWTSIVVVNKTCFVKVGYFNEKLNRGEDLDMWARLAREYDIVKSDLITGVYRHDSENKQSSGKSIYNKSILSIIDLKVKRGYERKYFKRMLINRIKYDIKTLDFKDAWIIISKHNLHLLK